MYMLEAPDFPAFRVQILSVGNWTANIINLNRNEDFIVKYFQLCFCDPFPGQPAVAHLFLLTSSRPVSGSHGVSTLAHAW